MGLQMLFHPQLPSNCSDKTVKINNGILHNVDMNDKMLKVLDDNNPELCEFDGKALSTFSNEESLAELEKQSIV